MTRTLAPLTAGERAAGLAAARAMVGVPFRHCGRTRKGIDCLGLVRHYLVAAGRDVPDDRGYGRRPEPQSDRLRETLRGYFGDPVADLQPGDVVVMTWHEVPNHVAIVGDYPLGGLSLIHALLQVQRVVEHRLAGEWPDRIVEGYRP